MRACTKPLIGRAGWDGEINQTDSYYCPYRPDTQVMSEGMTCFATESDFDAYKVEQWRVSGSSAGATALENLIKPLQEQYSEEFVLTHGDLHSSNIHLRRLTDSKGKPSTWELSGILDWGSSGFYPE